MILYYALGGGLGHLTRARAVAHTLGMEEELAVITASSSARDRRILGNAEAIVVPSELDGDIARFRCWLRDLLEERAPSAFYVDTFPAGILGELCDFPFPDTLPLHHITRLLRWENYRPLLTGSAPRYETIHRLEPLTGEHEAFLREHSSEIRALELCDPPAAIDPATLHHLHTWNNDRSPLWLILHSAPEEEILELLAYACDMAVMENIAPRYVLVTPSPQSPPLPSPPLSFLRLDIYPAYPLFPHAARIITACGFNVMRQAAIYREIHYFMPFQRRYDDQFLRAARNRG